MCSVYGSGESVSLDDDDTLLGGPECGASCDAVATAVG